MKNRLNKPIPQKQQGYVLFLVIIFVTVIFGSSASFLVKSVQHSNESGSIRDMSESLLMAESAMNRVMGQFLSSDDSQKAVNLPIFIDNEDSLAGIMAQIPYLYYINKTDSSDTREINQTSPSLLQIISNGEAANAGFIDLVSPKIVTSDADPLNALRINDLFDDTGLFRPFLFTMDPSNGFLTTSNALSWDSETSIEKVAVWLEAIQNETNSETVDIFVQAAAEIDGIKSYTQQYVGSYIPDRKLGNVALLVESSTVDRRRAVDHR